MISKEVHRLRNLKGWTRKELSKRSGVLVSAIETVENGDIGEMSTFRRERTLLELAHTLGVSMETLTQECKRKK